MNKMIIALPFAAFLAACSSNNGNQAGQGAGVTGAGSTFVYPVLSAWAADYKKQGGVDINYQSNRSDGSGTTFNFTHYLSQVSPSWKAGPGEGKSVAWPGGVGGKGNEGVAAYVRQIPNSLGYVEYAYAQQNKMNTASLQNAAGNFVA